MSNPFTYVELHTRNPEQAKQFYRRLFDWAIKDQETPMGQYSEIDTHEGFPGGLLGARPPEAPSQWLTYVRVDDVAASTRKAKELGAEILREVMAIPEGQFSVLRDPTGAMFGLWQPVNR